MKVLRIFLIITVSFCALFLALTDVAFANDDISGKYPFLDKFPYSQSQEERLNDILSFRTDADYDSKVKVLNITVEFAMQSPEDLFDYDLATEWLESLGLTITKYDPKLPIQIEYYRAALEPVLYERASALFGYSLEYKSEYCNESVNLTIGGDIDKLFSTNSHESMKAFCSITAAKENATGNGIRDWLEELGFYDVTFNISKDNRGMFDFDTSTFYLANREMSDGRTMVLAYVCGTAHAGEWTSDLNMYSVFNDDNGETHDGFWQTKEAISAEIYQYVKRRDIDPENVFFAMSGYSRGAGIVDLLAADETLCYVPLSETNCLAYTFGTPDSIRNKEGHNISWITNISSEKDPFDSWLANWTKNGQSFRYEYDENVINNFFGENNIGEGVDMFRGHRPENYIANVFTGKPQWEYQKFSLLWAWIRAHCPTDIYVMHNGETVASVINNVVTSNDPDVYVVCNDDGEKDIVYPESNEYSLLIEATDNGTMDVSKNVFGDEATQSDENQPKTYSITKGEVYELDAKTSEPMLLNEQDIPTDELSKIKSDVVKPSIASDSESTNDGDVEQSSFIDKILENIAEKQDTSVENVIIALIIVLCLLLIVIVYFIFKLSRSKN
jgi:Lipase (class 3).